MERLNLLFKICSLIILSFYFSLTSFSQDIHFSQYYFSPLTLNPALTGAYNGDYRFTFNYRNQWASVPVNYNTLSLAAEMPLTNPARYDRLAAGFIVYADRAGDSRFTASQIYGSLGYSKVLGAKEHVISFGVQPGFVNKNYQPNRLTYDNQFNGDIYDEHIPIIENPSRTSISYFDVGAGLNFIYNNNSRSRISAGVSVYHFTFPVQSFYNDDLVTLDIKYTAHALAQFRLKNKKWDLLPAFMYRKQDSKQEIVPAMYAKYYFRPSYKGNEFSIMYGLSYRWRDACILSGTVQYNQWQACLSYDINVSKFAKATSSYGAVEISAMYIITKVRNTNVCGKICPIF